MRPAVRRSVTAVGALVAVALAFTSGLVVGASTGEPVTTPPPDRLDDAASQISQSALSPVGVDALDAAAIRAMLVAAGDQWGTWSTDQATAATASGYAGIGVWLRTGPIGQVLVAQVTDGSSAAQRGVRPGDEVRAVNGRSADGEAAAAVADELRGAAGSQVRVLFRRGSVVRDLLLTRAPVAPPGVHILLEPASGSSPEVGRIVVPVFTSGVGRAVRGDLARLREAGVGGVVLDLRGNPGGLLDEAVETASAFLSGGPVVTYSRRDGRQQHLDALGGGDTATPLVVLVDGGTASAAEVVAGALQDRGRAVLVGSRTFGKGTVQEPRRLSDGSSLELTVARYRTPSGRSVDGIGLEPDIEVAPDADPQVAVRRAVEVLSGLVADSVPAAGGRG